MGEFPCVYKGMPIMVYPGVVNSITYIYNLQRYARGRVSFQPGSSRSYNNLHSYYKLMEQNIFNKLNEREKFLHRYTSYTYKANNKK